MHHFDNVHGGGRLSIGVIQLYANQFNFTLAGAARVVLFE